MFWRLSVISASLLISIAVGSCGQGGGSIPTETAESTGPTEASPAQSGKPSPEPEPIETVGGPETGLLMTIPEGFREVDPVRESEKAPSLDNVEGLFYVSAARTASDFDGSVMMVDWGARGQMFLSIINAQCLAHEDALEFSPEAIASSADLEAELEAGLVAVFGNGQAKATSIDGYKAARGESQISFTVDAGELSLSYVTYLIMADDKGCRAELFTQDASQVQKLDDVAATIDVL